MTAGQIWRWAYSFAGSRESWYMCAGWHGLLLCYELWNHHVGWTLWDIALIVLSWWMSTRTSSVRYWMAVDAAPSPVAFGVQWWRYLTRDLPASLKAVQLWKNHRDG